MKIYFSVGETAKAVHTTIETLRHYDRIGLVKPSKKDNFTNYRYYTQQDIVRLNTVRALQQMDLPLQKIKEVLEFDDLEKIIDFLKEAEKRADEKMALLSIVRQKYSWQNQIMRINFVGIPKQMVLLLNISWSVLSCFQIPLKPQHLISFGIT